MDVDSAHLTALARTRPRAVPRLAFALTCLGVFLVSLDVSITNAVLPAIGRTFAGESRQALAWTITAYAIAFAAALVPGGRLADRSGRRRVFVWGLGLFGAGSLICGAAPSLAVLIGGRVVQGLGAAVAQPASLGLLLAVTEPSRRSEYTARWFGAGAVGIGLGPLVGGALTEVADWRLAFLVNVPLVAWALVAAPRALRETERHPGRSLPDPLGAVLLAFAAAALTLGIADLTSWGPTDPRTLAALGTGLLAGALFVRRCARNPDPLLHLELLRARTFARVTLGTLLYSAAFFGLIFTFILFLTGVWGLSTVEAGLGITPMAGIVVLLSQRVGGLADRVGFAKPLTGGVLLIAAGLLLAAVVADGDSFRPVWLVIVVICGFGIGLCYPLLGAAALVEMPAGDLAAATAINQCARQLGASFGIAVSVAALGSAARPTVSGFHLAWVLSAGLCLAAAPALASIRTAHPGDA
jgi:EmrB/QacA subfamily drug resistance transporter